MPDYVSGGVRIHYELAGPDDGVPTLMVHGFASDYELNWVGSRWRDTMTRAGRLVVGIDLRGHGASDKPHDVAAYDQELVSQDLINLLDHLGIAEADYVGYSMGARLGVGLLLAHPERFGRAVFGGLGRLGAFPHADAVAARLRGEPVEDPIAETFWRFASARKSNDLEALAACIQGRVLLLGPGRLARIDRPVLMVAGDKDVIAPDSRQVAEMIPGARYLELPGRDHMTAVPARHFKEAALQFLEEA